MTQKEKNISLTKIIIPDKPARKHIKNEGIIELGKSMQKLGLLQPIIVVKKGTQYELEAGHRRYLAAKQLGWKEIKASVIDADDNQKIHLPRAHENLIRENLNPVEEAQHCHTLVYEEGRGIEKTALLLCKSQAWVEARIDILDFPQDLLDALEAGLTSIVVARALSKLQDLDKRKTLLEAAIDYGASANVVRQWISDSAITASLDQKETLSAIAEHVSIDIGVTKLECFICQVVQPMTQLRHIWVDSECLGFLIETAKVAQEEIAKGSE